MTEQVTVVFPAVSNDLIASGLRALTEELVQHGNGEALGGLGGEFGYGVDYANETFSMFPFYWGDCQCGFVDEEWTQSEKLTNEEYAAWAETHDHLNTCPLVTPNFKHFKSGLEVTWYKYIGRSMETNEAVTSAEWIDILKDCMGSVSK